MAFGIIFDIREFAVHDGPGIRTAVFLKGCPLRCAWCHNPEGLSFQPELMIRKSSCMNCGRCRQGCAHEECRPFGLCAKACPHGLIRIAGEKVDSAELAARLKRQAEFLARNGGGVTITGGEPLAQPEFLLALIEDLKPLHVAIETSAHADETVFQAMMERADLVLADLKHMDSEIHRCYTGVGNERILSNLSILLRSGKPCVVRVPLIPGINDSAESLGKMAEFIQGASGLIGVDLLPYNTLAGAKYHTVGLEYAAGFDVSARPNADCSAFARLGIHYAVL